MTDSEIEHLCDLAWQEKYLELKGLKIGDEVICSFSNHHGNAKQSYSSMVKGKGVIVETEKGIKVKSLEKYTLSRSEKRRPYDRNSYWVYYEDYVYSDLRFIKSKVENNYGNQV